jgi:amidase
VKPTVGLVSRSGIIPISHTQDTAGPMCRTVTDAAILLSVIAGRDAEDAATERRNGGTTEGVDYATLLDRGALRGARIGVARKEFWGYSPEADRVCEAALRALRDAGAVIVDPADIPHAGEYDGAEWQVLLYEFKADLNAYLRDWAPMSPAKTLADLIAFNERERAREMPYFGQEIFTLAEAKGPLSEKEYVDALETCGRLSRAEGIDAVMAEHRLDAIVAPTGSPAWPIDLVNGDHFQGASSTPGAVSGYPHLSLPVGHSFGLPVGLTFLGRPWSEGKLLALAYALEQTINARRPPRYLPTADLSTP